MNPWVPLTVAARAARRPTHTLRTWVRRSRVASACSLTDRTVLVFWPDVWDLTFAAEYRATRPRRATLAFSPPLLNTAPVRVSMPAPRQGGGLSAVEAMIRMATATLDVDTSRIERVLRILGRHATACADELAAERAKVETV